MLLLFLWNQAAVKTMVQKEHVSPALRQLMELGTVAAARH
jgi:hypothetical protein